VLGSRAKLRLLPLLLASLCSLGWRSVVLAESTHKRVVMVVDPSAMPLALRLRQEIESLGVMVRWRSAEPSRLPSLEQEANSAGAVASIRIAPMGGSDVDMTIFDRGTGKTVSWKLVAASTADPAADELIATRAVELLRASLAEMAARAAATPAPAAATPAPAAVSPASPEAQPAHDRAEPLSLLVGPSMFYSTSFRPGVHVLSTLTWLPFARAGLSAAVLAPVSPLRLVRPEGTVDVYASLYRLGGVLEVTDPRAPVSLRLTAAAGLGTLQLRGDATAAYVGASEKRLVACPSLVITARIRLATHLHVFIDASASAAFPKTVIRLAGRDATEWGRPALTGAFGLEVSGFGSGR
jgi:hypothetical protein